MFYKRCGVSFIIRRGRARDTWQVEARVPDAGTALRVLERWVREFPREYAEVEGIAGVFACHDPALNAAPALHTRHARDRLYSRRATPKARQRFPKVQSNEPPAGAVR